MTVRIPPLDTVFLDPFFVCLFIHSFLCIHPFLCFFFYSFIHIVTHSLIHRFILFLHYFNHPFINVLKGVYTLRGCPLAAPNSSNPRCLYTQSNFEPILRHLTHPLHGVYTLRASYNPFCGTQLIQPTVFIHSG